MTITAYQHRRIGALTQVTVTSDLTPGAGAVIYYHWYLGGRYVGRTTSPTKTFMPDCGEQVRVVVNDTTDADYDYVGNAPAGYPGRRQLHWVPSLTGEPYAYAIAMQRDGGDWVEIGRVLHDPDRWACSHVSPQLVDLGEYVFRVTPVDKAGNDGTAISLGSETIVRTPDAPDFDVAFDPGTLKVTFSEAA